MLCNKPHCTGIHIMSYIEKIQTVPYKNYRTKFLTIVNHFYATVAYDTILSFFQEANLKLKNPTPDICRSQVKNFIHSNNHLPIELFYNQIDKMKLNRNQTYGT